MSANTSSIFTTASNVPSRPLLRLLPGGTGDRRRKNTGPQARGAMFPEYPAGRLRRLLSPRRPAERALLSVIQETYLAGTGTRAIDALAERIGIVEAGPALLEVQASEWDRRVDAFRRRRLGQPYPFLLVYETAALVRTQGGAQTCRVTVAAGVAESGKKDVVAIAIQPADSGVAFWEAFFLDLKDRGLTGLKVVTSDHIEGLPAALARVFSGVRWQWCRERFIAEMLRLVPRTGRAAVESTLRAAFAQPDAASARRALARARAQFEFAFLDLVDALDTPLEALLTYFGVDAKHQRLVASLNALSSLQHDLRHACELVGIFPNEQALLRLAGTIAEEFSDEWAAHPQRSRRRARATAALAGAALAQAWAA